MTQHLSPEAMKKAPLWLRIHIEQLYAEIAALERLVPPAASSEYPTIFWEQTGLVNRRKYTIPGDASIYFSVAGGSFHLRIDKQHGVLLIYADTRMLKGDMVILPQASNHLMLGFR